MGFLDRAKLIKGAYADAFASVPRWARIVRIGRKVGPVTSIDLEIHHGNEPIQVVNTMSWIPRGVTPTVGQDVAYHISVGGDHGGNHTHYEIEWDKPPQYGPPPGPYPTR